LLDTEKILAKQLLRNSPLLTCFVDQPNCRIGRKNSRLFNRCVSWQTEKCALGLQLLRVDLTTAQGKSSRSLRKHYQELKRRVYRTYGYDIDSFVVETNEGNGLLHTLWAIPAKKAVWIEQRWLSGEWQKIHGSKIVLIKRARQAKSDRLNIARYFSHQPLIRFSYSWRKTRLPLGSSWALLKRKFKNLRRDRALNFGDLIRAWEGLLATGRCVLASLKVSVINREIFVYT
jgi:hypothetical protein